MKVKNQAGYPIKVGGYVFYKGTNIVENYFSDMQDFKDCVKAGQFVIMDKPQKRVAGKNKEEDESENKPSRKTRKRADRVEEVTSLDIDSE